MRRLLIFALTVLFSLGSIAVLFDALQVRREALFGVVNPISAGSLPFRSEVFGVNAELTAYEDAQLLHQLQLMRDAGVTWVRQFIYWDRVEPVRGNQDWAEYDRIIDAVDSIDGLQLVAVIMNTPAWARDSEANNDPTSPPADPVEFARFASSFASRYAAAVDFVQVWDEPNLYTNWGRLPPRAARYTAILTEAYHALHAADPTMTVIAAALAPTIETGPDNISELVFLNDMYIFGAGPVMDAAAGKPYGFDFPPDDRRNHDRLLNFSRFAQMREVMIVHGDSSKPLWGSQWGWNSLPDDWSGLPSIWGSVSAEEQISYTLGAIERAETEWPWIGGLILHHWNPPYPLDFPQQGFALTTTGGLPTPLLSALIERAKERHAVSGWYPVRTDQAAYSGVWTFGAAGADIGWLRDSRVRFTFKGTDIALLLRQDDYVAHLYVSVDGKPANALPRDAAGNAYLVLSSGSLHPEYGPVLVAQNLQPGVHVLEVIADQGYDRYALAGFAVGTGDLSRAYDAWVVGSAAAALASLGACIVSVASLPIRSWNSRFRHLFSALSLPAQLAISLVTSIALMLTFLLSLGSPEPPLIRRDPALPLIAFLSAGTVYLNLAIPITILAAGLLFWCILQRISIGLMLTLFFAPFFLFPVELYSFAFPMVEVVALITFAAWGVSQLSELAKMRQVGAPMVFAIRRLRWPDRLTLIFLILGTVALTWSKIPGFALTEYRVLFIEPVMFYVLLRTSRLTASEMRWLITMLLASGAIVAGISLFQYAGGQAIIVAEDSSRRLAGIYGSPNNLALFLGRCLPFAFAAVLIARERRTKWAAALLGLLMFSAVLLTQSVGGIFIGLPAAAIAMLVLTYGRRAIPVLIVFAIVVAVSFGIAASQSDRFARALDFTQGTNFYRIRVMQSALQAIADRPLTGLGLDQFLYAFRDTYIYPDAWPEPNLSHPHNFLLDFWVRLGLGGAALSLGFVVVSLKLSTYSIRIARRAEFWNWVALGISGAFVITFAHGLLDNSLFVIDLVYIFFALLGVTCWITAENRNLSPT